MRGAWNRAPPGRGEGVPPVLWAVSTLVFASGIEAAALSVVRVQTGVLDDGRHRGRQLVVAGLGWVVSFALIGLLIGHAGEIAVQVSLFLVSVAVVVAVLSTAAAIDIFRPALIRARSGKPRRLEIDVTRDALGRSFDVAGVESMLGGEILIEQVGDVRRYRRGEVGR